MTLKSLEGESYKFEREAVIAQLEDALETAKNGVYTQLILLMAPPVSPGKIENGSITYCTFHNLSNALGMVEMLKFDMIAGTKLEGTL